MDSRAVVNEHLWDFLSDVGGIFNLSHGQIEDFYRNLYALAEADPFGILYASLALIISVWLMIKGVHLDIPGWITDAIDFLTNTVRQAWDWLVSTVSQLHDWIQHAGDTIGGIAWAIIQQFEKSIEGALAAAYWLANVGWGILTAFVDNATQFIRDRVLPVIDELLRPITDAINNLRAFFDNWGQVLTAFASNPVKFTVDIVTPVIQAWFEPLGKYLDFLTWLVDNFAQTIAAFVNDPRGFIFDIITPGFVDWLLEKLSEGW